MNNIIDVIKCLFDRILDFLYSDVAVEVVFAIKDFLLGCIQILRDFFDIWIN